MSDSLPAHPSLETEADRIIAELGIPPCPALLAEVTREMRAPEPALRRLASLLTQDVAVSAALLKMVNSSFYGLASKATSIQQALSVLGLNAAANLVAGVMLRQAFPAPAGSPMERFWTSSMALARTAAGIAGRVRSLPRDEAHTFALFRDCGVAVMIQRYPDYAAHGGNGSVSVGGGVTIHEERRYRYHHGRVGAALARGWSLPERLCSAIQHHHDLESAMQGRIGLGAESRRLIAFGLLAEQVVSLRDGRGLCLDWRRAESFVLGMLNLTPDEVVGLVDAGADLEEQAAA